MERSAIVFSSFAVSALLALAGCSSSAEKRSVGYVSSANARQVGGESNQKLKLAANPPPKDKPVVMVFGGSFSPMHMGHLKTAQNAIRLLRESGYKVRKLIMCPSPDRILVEKLGAAAYPLEDRLALGKVSVQGLKDIFIEIYRSLGRCCAGGGKFSRRAQTDAARGLGAAPLSGCDHRQRHRRGSSDRAWSRASRFSVAVRWHARQQSRRLLLSGACAARGHHFIDEDSRADCGKQTDSAALHASGRSAALG